MNKPDAKLESELNKLNLYFLDERSIIDPKFEGNYVGVAVEIAVMVDALPASPEFSVSRISPRGCTTLFTDWQFIERDGQKLLTFQAWQRIPTGTPSPLGGQFVMSYMDLCYYAGNEAVPETYGDDVITKVRADYKPTDLGWIVPGRFTDALVDALHDLDNTMLGGNAEHALLYGPLLKIDSSP